jgi:hypothetical protein
VNAPTAPELDACHADEARTVLAAERHRDTITGDDYADALTRALAEAPAP